MSGVWITHRFSRAARGSDPPTPRPIVSRSPSAIPARRTSFGFELRLLARMHTMNHLVLTWIPRELTWYLCLATR